MESKTNPSHSVPSSMRTVCQVPFEWCLVAFLVWAGEPHLEARHKIGFKTIIYLVILLTLVYLSKKKVWSRFDNKKDPEEDPFDKAEDWVTEYEGEDPKTFK